MTDRNFKLRFSLFLLLAVMVGVVPMFGASAVVGSVAGSTNATIGGQALVPNTTLFSGDSLRVNDGAAVIAMGMGSRMVFGRDSVASFERGADEVTVLLGQGNVSMYHPQEGVALRVKIGEVTVASGKGFKTLGEVAMVNGTIVITAKEGMLRVQGPDRSLEVTKGHTIAIMPKTAGSPQPGQGSAGRPASHPSAGAYIAVGSLAAAGAGVVVGVINLHKLNQLKDQNTRTDADAQAAIAAANQADKDAVAATAAATAAKNAANQAGMLASIACQTVSPSSTTCTFVPVP